MAGWKVGGCQEEKVDLQIESTADAKQDAMRHDIMDAAMSSQGMMKNKVGGGRERDLAKEVVSGRSGALSACSGA